MPPPLRVLHAASHPRVYPITAKKAKTKGKKPVAPKPKKDASGVAGLKPTVGTQFKDQLHNLMDMIRWGVRRVAGGTRSSSKQRSV